jgi:hypothetical protein
LKAAVGSPGEIVTTHGFKTSGTSKIEFFLPDFGDPLEQTARFGEVMLTTEAVSTFGDSGAIALLEPGEELIGHVVAGVPATDSYEGYTVIQDLTTNCGTFPRDFRDEAKQRKGDQGLR